MKGVEFLVDDSGKKRAVLIDLERWGDLWEDFYDVLASESRKKNLLCFAVSLNLKRSC